MARWAIGICLALLLTGCGGNPGGSNNSATLRPPDWPAPPNAMTLAKKAGLVPERAEFLRYHVHAHLDVLVDGKPVVVRAGIGININDPAVKVFPEPDGTKSYGGIRPPCAKPCISPLHTHFVDGILHTESKTPTPNKLGQFFIEWNIRLTPECVGEFCKPKVPVSIYVNGEKYDGDPREIELSYQRRQYQLGRMTSLRVRTRSERPPKRRSGPGSS